MNTNEGRAKLKILALSLDAKLIEEGSNVSERAKSYGEITEKYDVIVPASQQETLKLSSDVTVYGIGGLMKLQKLARIYRMAKRLLVSSGSVQSGKSYDLITVQDPYFLGMMALALSRRFGVPFEVQVHGFEKLSPLRRTVAKLLLSRAQGIRTVSPRLAHELARDFGVEKKKITIVPVYSDLEPDLGNISAEKVSISGQFIFLTMSRLVEVKNISLQLRVFAQIKDKLSGAKLWIVGDGPLKQRLENEARSLGIASDVTFVGWAKDPHIYYAQADVFLLTSRSEGWSLVAVEAAAHGLPVIMTDVGCAGSVIVDGQNGFVIPTSHNEDALAKAMIELYQNEQVREEFGKKGREAVAGLPSKEETLRLYEQGWWNAIAQARAHLDDHAHDKEIMKK